MVDSHTSEIEKYVIEEVKRRRVELGWSQKDLAYEIDVSIGFVGNVENPNQRAKYNLTHINAIAKAFGCSPKDLLPIKPI